MKIPLSLLVGLCLAPGAVVAQSAPVTGTASIQWGAAPAVFPSGAQMAVVQGDPAVAGLYTVRLRMPSGYRIPPHHHPTDEHLTVLEGTFHVGMGTTVTRSGALTLEPGGFATAAGGEPHYAWTEGTTVVQVHGMGPFQLTYVSPADDPRRTR